MTIQIFVCVKYEIIIIIMIVLRKLLIGNYVVCMDSKEKRKGMSMSHKVC